MDFKSLIGKRFQGNNAEIEDRVTFHALKEISIKIGNNLDTDDNIVFHDPLEVGNNLTIGDDAVLFRSKVGNRVLIGTGALVIGVNLRDNAQVPENAVSYPGGCTAYAPAKVTTLNESPSP